MDTARIEQLTGLKGVLDWDSPKVMFMHETKMHVDTWAAFAGSDDKAIVDGDFAMLETELQGVLKALRSAGIQVVAIHQHMTGETPRVMFLHYWGIGPTEKLARGLKAALATQR